MYSCKDGRVFFNEVCIGLLKDHGVEDGDVVNLQVYYEDDAIVGHLLNGEMMTPPTPAKYSPRNLPNMGDIVVINTQLNAGRLAKVVTIDYKNKRVEVRWLKANGELGRKSEYNATSLCVLADFKSKEVVPKQATLHLTSGLEDVPPLPVLTDDGRIDELEDKVTALELTVDKASDEVDELRIAATRTIRALDSNDSRKRRKKKQIRRRLSKKRKKLPSWLIATITTMTIVGLIVAALFH